MKKIIYIGIISMFLLMNVSVNAYTSTTNSENTTVDILRIDNDLRECPNADYTSIQEAIDNEDLHDYYSIEVYKGTYYENIVFEDYGDYNPHFDVIDKENTWIVGQTGNVISVVNSDISLKLDGFKIKCLGTPGNGIVSKGTLRLENCAIEKIPGTGVIAERNLNVINCVISGCDKDGIVIKSTFYNEINNNIIKDNGGIGLKISYVDGGDPSGLNPAKIYHNDFINNGQNAIDRYFFKESPADIRKIPIACEWDNGEIGNFWSDYTGVDDDNDGIGDTSYILSEPDSDEDRDRYPSIAPFNFDNSRPSQPIIDGPTQAKILKEQEFTLFATDPDGEKISFLVDWGDGNTHHTELVESGEEYVISHTWNTIGDYDIKVNAIDIKGIYGPTSDPLSISLPKNKVIDGSLLNNVLERFPILLNFFELLQKL